MLQRALTVSGGGGGVDMSPLFGKDIAFVDADSVERPLCPVIGVSHIKITKYSSAAGSITVYGVDENGNKTQIHSGTGATNIDVSNYIMLTGIRASANATAYYIKYVD